MIGILSLLFILSTTLLSTKPKEVYYTNSPYAEGLYALGFGDQKFAYIEHVYKESAGSFI